MQWLIQRLFVASICWPWGEYNVSLVEGIIDCMGEAFVFIFKIKWRENCCMVLVLCLFQGRYIVLV